MVAKLLKKNVTTKYQAVYLQKCIRVICIIPLSSFGEEDRRLIDSILYIKPNDYAQVF